MKFGVFIKSNDSRTFVALISADNIDLQGDIIPVEVLSEAFEIYQKSGGQLQLLHGNIPVGKLLEHRIVPLPNNLKGVEVVGQIFNDGRSIPDKIWRIFQTNAPSDGLQSGVGFSIGGKPVKMHYDTIKGKQVRVLDKIELYEVSVICSIDGEHHEPANPMATLQSISNSSAPVFVKMVIDKMPEDKEKVKSSFFKEDQKPMDDKSKSDVSKEDEDSSDAKAIEEKVKKEAQALSGDSELFAVLTEYKQRVETLTKENSDLKSKVDSLIKEKEAADSDSKLLKKQLAEEKIASDTWKKLYSQTVSRRDTIEKMLQTPNVAIVSGGTPSNQGRAVEKAISKRKEEDMMIVKEYEKSKNLGFDNPIFQKAVAAGKRLQLNQYD